MAPDDAGNAAAARKYHDKEAFVTGHAGTTPIEILLLCLVIPVGLCLYYRVRSLLGGGRRRDKGFAWVDAAVEAAALFLPMLLMQTSILPYLSGPAALLLGMLAVALLVPNKRSGGNIDQSATSAQNGSSDEQSRRPAFLSVHRSCVYILTTIAILAVDFPIFPRRFCKTEVDGYGWMDLGAASFVIIAGWASAISSSSARSATSAPKNDALGALALRAAKKCAPLLIIGLVRLATNKGLEYQEHVSEYGVHWNFFFTLCCIEGFNVVWKGLKRRLGSVSAKLPLDAALAVAMIVPYQLYLSEYGGQDFVENGDRRCGASYSGWAPTWLCGIFVANREGILGVVGYVSLRLFSEGIAKVCLLPAQNGSGRTGLQQRLVAMTALLWTGHFFLVGLGIPNSRRSTNASFILWSLSHNLTLLSLIHLVMKRERTEEDVSSQTPQILEAVNSHGLAVFLGSNILTGLVNLTVDTLHSSNAKALCVLSVYLALVCGLALILDHVIFKKKGKVE